MKIQEEEINLINEETMICLKEQFPETVKKMNYFFKLASRKDKPSGKKEFLEWSDLYEEVKEVLFVCFEIAQERLGV